MSTASGIERKIRVGDRVVTDEEQLPYFSEGDEGIVLEVSEDGELDVQFTKQKQGRYKDGQWYVTHYTILERYYNFNEIEPQDFSL